jgi:Holliday junction resolvasome RuvABC endonuclease subunit
VTTPSPAATTAAGPRPRVAGIDVSLTSTGIATLGGTTHVPTTGRRRDPLAARHRRLTHISRTVLEQIGDVDLAVVEGPSHHSIGGSTWDRGGLWWLIIDGLLRRDIPTAVVAPRGRAKYATGNGNAGKDAVIDAAETRYGRTFANDDEADAWVLMAMGYHQAGHPLAEVPAGHAVALVAVEWPEFGVVAR